MTSSFLSFVLKFTKGQEMKKNEKSINLRTDPLFLRDSYPTTDLYQFSIIKKAPEFEIKKLISFRQMGKCVTFAYPERVAVHFFKDDYRFEKFYTSPKDEDITALAQYPCTFTPDFSLYPEMPLWMQIQQVAKSRWCGAHWQASGLWVIPSISWSTKESFDFCFDGIETGSAVAVSTVGNRGNSKAFLLGYNKMLEVINPEVIYCYGTVFPEMKGKIVEFPYEAFLKEGA